jgi:hypothetical protein
MSPDPVHIPHCNFPQTSQPSSGCLLRCPPNRCVSFPYLGASLCEASANPWFSTVINCYVKFFTPNHIDGENLEAAIRSDLLTCFFRIMTLNRSKSVSCRLRSVFARALAGLLSTHFASTSASCHFLSSGPERMPRGRFSMTIGVRRICKIEAEWRGTGASLDGPSTKICESL